MVLPGSSPKGVVHIANVIRGFHVATRLLRPIKDVYAWSSEAGACGALRRDYVFRGNVVLTARFPHMRTLTGHLG